MNRGMRPPHVHSSYLVALLKACLAAGMPALLSAAAPVLPQVGDYAPPASEEHRARFDYRKVSPLFDTPLRDTAVTRGPDGVYYLTGTSGTPRGDGTIDFAVNDGIYVWSSPDLENWTPMGKVAGLQQNKARQGDLGLLRTAAGESEFKGLIAPELHFAKGTWWLTYALRPQGTGLLESTSRRPEGPYEDVGLITTDGQDASLFVDDDQTVYWVFAGGWIARMRDDMTGLAEEPRLLRPFDGSETVNGPGGQALQVGTGGAFLFRRDGKYHLLAAGIHGRIGVPCYDTFVAVGDSVYGPYGPRLLAVAHGGQATMFEGPDGQWYSTFNGVDSRAALRDRPAIVPVDWVTTVKYYYPRDLSWPWKQGRVVTEAWGWENARPFSDLTFRDIGIVNGRDGYYYFSGLHNDGRLDKSNVFLRGKDLAGAEPWELLEFHGLEKVTDLPWYEYRPAQGGRGDGWQNLRMTSCKLFFENDTFWATTSAGDNCGVLRSKSGTMMGPWEVVRVGYPGGIKGSAHVRRDYEGNLWLAVRSYLWPVTPQVELDLGRPLPAAKGGYRPPAGRGQSYEVETVDGSSFIRGDVGRYYYQVDGKYLMLGTAWHGNYRRFGTYDAQIFWADEIIGPYHNSRAVLPHGGHAGIVQDNDGQWWMTSFTNDGFLPDHGVRAVPVDLTWNGERYEVRSRNPGDASLTWSFEPETIRPQATDVKAAYPVVTITADLPIADPAITRVEGNGETVYYLTGTAGTETDGGIDFHNNTGIYLWKSSDLKTWEPLGKVFDMGPDKPSGGFGALGYYFSPPDSLEPRYDRGLIAPELHRVHGGWYLTASSSRQGIAIFRSTTGGPQGPYEMIGPAGGHGTVGFIADSGAGTENNTDACLFAYDPTVFEDDDGSAYLLFGNGWIARLKDDLSAMAEVPRLLGIKGGELGRRPLEIGRGGFFLRREEGRYRLTATTRWGDVVEAVSDAVYGPYEDLRIVLPQAGQVTIFRGRDGRWHAAVAARRKGA